MDIVCEEGKKDFNSSPYRIKVLKDYVLSFGETPEELKEWVLNMDWIRSGILEEWNRRKEAQGVSNETLPMHRNHVLCYI